MVQGKPQIVTMRRGVTVTRGETYLCVLKRKSDKTVFIKVFKTPKEFLNTRMQFQVFEYITRQ